MTDGEKMIWAAAFAGAIEVGMELPSATWSATVAVMRLRAHFERRAYESITDAQVDDFTRAMVQD